MAKMAQRAGFGRHLLQPLHGPVLAAGGTAIWLAGASYCHGYEQLLSGLAEWPGSLLWSAIAVLPWFALFEWSKRDGGREAIRQPATLAALLVAIAAASIATEYLVNLSMGHWTSPIGLLILRRLPAVAATLMLIGLAAKERARQVGDVADLEGLAQSIEYVAAADNYVEIHLPGRVTLKRMTLADATTVLHGRGFLRLHRRFLVNGAQVEAVHRQGRAFVRLRSGAKIPVGRAYAANLPRD
jgi:hypothetical protein